MAKSVTADELELSADDLDALEEMDDLLDDDDDEQPIASVDPLDDDENDNGQPETDEYPCPVCGQVRDSMEELEFHLSRKHPDYPPPAPEIEPLDEPEGAEDPADVLEDTLATSASEQIAEPPRPARARRSRRTKAEIEAAKADIARQRAAEKTNGKEPPETAVQEREYLAAAMNRDDDDEVARARHEAIARLKAQTGVRTGGEVFAGEENVTVLGDEAASLLAEDTSSHDLPEPQTPGEDSLTHHGYAYRPDGAPSLKALAVSKPQPWVDVKITITGTVAEVADFLRSLAVAAEATGVEVSAGR